MTPATTVVERGNTSAYQQKLAGLLGSRDPITVLGETADVLAKIARDNSPTRMKSRPFPGKWTPNEIIGHLTDAEWVYGYRMRQILCEDEPTILSMDQDLWVTGQHHNERDPAELVDMFRHLRQYNLFIWKYIGPEKLKRIGKHAERGPESLGLMLKMNAGHDLSHIDQITRYLTAIK